MFCCVCVFLLSATPILCHLCVCVCVGAWWQQHGAPAPHLLTTLLLYYPGLSTTSVPDYSITKGGNIVEDVSYVTSTNSTSCVFALLLTLVLVAHPVENSSIIPLCFLRANLPALLCVGCRRPCLPACLPACLADSQHARLPVSTWISCLLTTYAPPRNIPFLPESSVSGLCI